MCTEAPFTGTCSAVNSSNAKLGVKCPCATSNNYECVGCEFKNNVCVLCGAGKHNDEFYHKHVSCKNCGVGKFNNLEGQSDEAVACKDCGVGKFNNVKGNPNCKASGVGKLNNISVYYKHLNLPTICSV